MCKRLLWTIIGVLIPVVGSAQSVLYFPQVADGIAGAGGWITGVGVTNPAAAGSATVSGTITFTRDDGTPFNLSFADENKNPVGSGNTIPFQIGGGQTRYFISQAAGALAVGYATITSSQPVVAGLIFEQINFPNIRVGEAGVGAATPMTQFSIFAIEDKNDTGVALVNTGTAAATVTFQLVDNTGAQVTPPVTRNLPAKNHTAFFVSQLFSQFFTGQKFYGTVRISSTAPLAAVALLFENTGQFATLPIVPGQ